MNTSLLLSLCIALALLASSCDPSNSSRPSATSSVPAGAPTRDSRLKAVTSARTINYYPAGYAWTNMWTEWGRLDLQQDINDALKLGASNMRIIIFPKVFEFPVPKPEYLARLKSFVDLCKANGLTVSFTLFDWWSAYEAKEDSLIWAKAIIERYKDDATVINIELQNEFPADLFMNGEPETGVKKNPSAFVWAQYMIDELHKAYPTMPLTFSVNSMKNFTALKRNIRNMDYYDYHYYESGALAFALLKDALALAGDKPLVIGEAGLNTWQKSPADATQASAESGTAGQGNTEGQQAAFFAGTMNAVKELQINSLAVWALYDFTADAIPKDSQVARKPEQKFYGVYRSDRSPKAAVEVIRKAWAGTVLRSKDVLDLGFEHTTDKVNPWTPYRPDLGEAERSSDWRHNGMGSIKFTRTGSSGSTYPSMRVSPVEIVRPGEKWKVTAWAKGSIDANGTTRVTLSWFDKNRVYLPGPGVQAPALLPRGMTVWTQLSVEETAPDNAAYLEVHLQSGNNTVGSVWFDDVVIVTPADLKTGA